MNPTDLERAFLDLTTAHVADGLLRLGLPVRCAPASVRPLWSGCRVVGRALPARHHGSVDVFLEALERATPGDVLVVDNAGRDDEACVDAQEPDAFDRARLGGHVVTPDAVVLGDDDGVVLLPLDRAEEVAQAARGIRDTEHRQAASMASGSRLRDQLGFADFLAERAATGTTFRQFLRTRGGAVEE